MKSEARRQIEETMAESMAIQNVFMNFFAAVIAFAIIYNATAISLTERTRELASLRVLGFTLGEIRRIVFGENIMLSVVGLIAGIPLGMYLCKIVIRAFDTDMYRFPFYISQKTFLATIASIAVFVFIANLASRRSIARLDMVEVLKMRE
jgi:putative ABC transport system permease protein